MTPMTPVAARTALSAPQGTDPAQLAALIALMQGIANRGEWNAKSLIVPYAKNLAMGGEDYPDTVSTWVTVDRLGANPISYPLTVEVGDLVYMTASGAITFDSSTASSYGLRFFDGTNTLAEIGWGSSANFSSTDSRPLSLSGLHVVTAAGAKDYTLQGYRSGSLTPVGSGDLRTALVHIRLGAT